MHYILCTEGRPNRVCQSRAEVGDPRVIRAIGVAFSSKRGYKDLDWQRVIDHIAAEIGIVTFWLRPSVCSRRAGQKRKAARLCRRDPIVFPTAPCVPAYWIDEVALNPRCAPIEADPYFSDLGVPGPSGAKNGVGATRSEPLVYTGTRDLRLQFHFREWPAHGYPLGIIPIAVVGSLPIALKWLRGRNDLGQPLDRRHAVISRNDGAQRISMILCDHVSPS
jgi:hypothetical protein